MTDKEEQKEISSKLDTLSLDVAKGFARNDALSESINRRLDVLNGKVAKHEESLNAQAIKEAVQADRVANLQKNDEDGKWLTKSLRGQGVQIIFDLMKMGLVALIVFWLARR